MAWEFSNERPIYTQLIEQISIRIIGGWLLPGERLPSVRDLAEQAQVNPNTMQRALAELENLGLLRSERTSGRFITEDAAVIERLKQQLAITQIKSFFHRMEELGIDHAQALVMANDYQQEENKR
ncbi:MAG: GntR family transcriptional regulator [Bacillota bacterium]|nr:GntR family transcriptional regulator [Bacillota bacterium]